MSVSPAGVLVPITTPFDAATGEIAPVALRENARAMVADGVTGFLAAGSTGEAPLLTERESVQVVEWLREILPDEACLMAGTGRESTRASVEACREAARAGADCVLVRPPAYFASALTDDDLLGHFRAVADASPVPVYVYNIPKYTHLPLPPRLLAELAAHPNIRGAKDSSGDLKNFAAYRDAVPDWTLLVGSGAALYPALEMGAAGGIVAVANYAATLSVEVHRAFAAGDRAASGAAQERLTPLHREIVAALGPAGVKRAMDEIGLIGGPARPPLGDLTPAGRASMMAALEGAGLI